MRVLVEPLEEILASAVIYVLPYHIETSPLICYANQCTGFCMIETSIMKKLKGLTKIFGKASNLYFACDLCTAASTAVSSGESYFPIINTCLE